MSRQVLIPGVLFLLALLGSAAPIQASPPDHQLVHLQFKSQSELQTWINNGLDVWQVEGNTALASLSKTQISALESQGVAPTFVPAPAMVDFPACYRTYDDLVTFLHEQQAQYPQLVHFYDIGDSWEAQNGSMQRDIHVARLTSPEGPENKPRLLIVAEQHAREIITPEVAMGFIDDLLRNYGDNPTATWLLDTREIWVIPMANPDGHAHAAQEQNWRKTANHTVSCQFGTPPNTFGVDLNRNFGFEWGHEAGSSSDPCILTYRGDAPFSEPEAQALRDLILEKGFDMIVSLHSYGDSVLYPWAYIRDPAPHAQSLDALATRMAMPAGYRAMQGTELGYTASGDMADWTYGELGIPSFTFEIGGMEDGFFWPPCNVKDQLYTEVRPALIFAAQAAAHPYEVAGGPEARDIAVDVSESEVTIRAWISDQWSGDDQIQSAELFVDTMGETGTGIPLVPEDGACNYRTEWLDATLDEDVLARYAGRRVPIMIVAEDVTGRRGVPSVAWLDLRNQRVTGLESVKLWLGSTEEPAFEIKDGRVYQGAAGNGDVVMTVDDGKVYRGAGETGTLLYVFDGTQVRAGENGPVVYSEQGDKIYLGPLEDGVLLYRIDYDQVLNVRTAEDTVALSANVNLAADGVRTARLLLPILMEHHY